MVREGLGVAGKGLEYDTLVRRDMTQAERRHSKTYHVGDVIQPEQDYQRLGLKRGALYRVEDTGPGNRLVVRRMMEEREASPAAGRAEPEGETITFSPRLATKLSVYQHQRAELSVGDRVRITRNNAELDVANGDRFQVEAVAKDRVTLGNGARRVELTADKPLHLDHAYVTTVHSSQGLTADRVLIDAHAESRTTAKDVYYVAISRARHEVRIFTNSVKKLPAAIMREAIKHAALDLAREHGGLIGDRTRRTLHERMRGTQHGMERRSADAGMRERTVDAARSRELGRQGGNKEKGRRREVGG